MRSVCIATALLITTGAFAQSDIEITTPIEKTVPVQVKPQTHGVYQSAPSQQVTLMGVNLSEQAWTKLDERIGDIAQSPDTLKTPSCEGKRVGCFNTQLGMNNVPVLNQGRHGACATFANTAAIDATLGRGEYTSQLCHLQLGRKLEKYGYNPSGWNGSLGPIVLGQIQAFGIVSKRSEADTGCGGATSYPSDDNLPGEEMSLKEFHKLSEQLPEQFGWTSLLDVHNAFIDKTNPNHTLDAVKNSLRQKDRLTFGVLLFGFDKGVAGASGEYKVKNDTWVITPEITEDILKRKNYGGHEMIITGFNDFAVATDPHGYQHRGLLTIRNSWGNKIGNGGDFYMSYDYFKMLVMEVQRIRGAE